MTNRSEPLSGTRHWIEREKVRLSCLDYGGQGDTVLLLHGLAGYADEWRETADRLRGRYRVLALEQRGHGESKRRPADVSRRAYVEDAAAAIEQLDLAPVVLIGQSLGGHTAFLTAARYPDLVRALVVAEASAGGPDTDAPRQVRDALGDWPVPFPSLAAARAFFGGETLAARVWAEGLERREGGWWPRFDLDVMVASLSEGAGRSFWEEWAQVRCPTLIVVGERGLVPADEAQAMHERLPSSELVTLPGASHDLHLDRPDEWCAVLDRFLAHASTR